MTNPISIEVKNLSCKLGSHMALSDVSFSLTAGTVVSLVGQNGAGKTTLLRSILRLQEFRGEVNIEGQALRSLSRRALAGLLAYVPQHTSLNVPFPVREFLLLSRYSYNGPFVAPSQQDHDAVAESLEATGTAKLAHRIVGTLSGGEQQRVLIASALAQGARCLLLDEPANHLDPRFQEEVFALLMSLKSSHQLTILAVHHDLNQAVLMSDQVLALRDGRLVYSGLAADLMEPARLREIYEMDFLFVTHPTHPIQMVVPKGY